MKYNKALCNIIAVFLLALMSACIVGSASFAHFNMVFYGNANAVSLPPHAKLIYDNKKFSMSPFILISGGNLNKVGFPALPDSNTQLDVQVGTLIGFEFSQTPLNVQAFIVDYDGDNPSVLPLKKIGSKFQIAGPPGIWNIETHATFPGGQYSSFTALVNVRGTSNSLAIQSNGQQPACSSQNNLHIQDVTDSNNNSNGVAIASSFNGNNTDTNPNGITWSGTGKGSWIQFDLGKEKSICKLLIGFANGDKIINFFTIYTSTDGIHFANDGSIQNTGMVSGVELFNIPNSPISARYVKLSFESGGQGELHEISNMKVIGNDNISSGANGQNGSNVAGSNGVNLNGNNNLVGGNGGNGGNASGGNGGNGGNVNVDNRRNVNGANGANGGVVNGTNGANGGIVNGANGANGHNVNGANGASGGVVNGANGHNVNGANGHNVNGANGHNVNGANGIGGNGANGIGGNGGNVTGGNGGNVTGGNGGNVTGGNGGNVTGAKGGVASGAKGGVASGGNG
jgi:hypothetical protein